MIKRSIGLLTVLLAAVGCGRSGPVVTPAPAFPSSFAFVASSEPDSSVRGTFEGTATFADGWLTVTVPRSTISLPPGNTENWRNLTVRAFVASDFRSSEDWRAVAQSRPVNIFRFLPLVGTQSTERRTVTLEEGLRFVVPVPPGAVASTSRLALEMEWVFLMGTYGDTDSRIAFSGPIGRP